jgi:hypothetical protein
MIMLPVGAELDRFGEPSGNVTYAARTKYPHRSLPQDWIELSYHLYRLARPVQAVAGVAVPWFDQPGTGIAYVLPRSVDELVADGALVEVSAEEGAAVARDMATDRAGIGNREDA